MSSWNPFLSLKNGFLSPRILRTLGCLCTWTHRQWLSFWALQGPASLFRLRAWEGFQVMVLKLRNQQIFRPSFKNLSRCPDPWATNLLGVTR